MDMDMDMDGSGDHSLADHLPQFPIVGDWVDDYLLGFGNTLIRGGLEDQLLSDDPSSSAASTKDDYSSSTSWWVNNNNHVQQADADVDPLSLSLSLSLSLWGIIMCYDDSLEEEPAANYNVLTTTTTEEPDDRTVWSEDEHKELLHRLHMYAEDDAATRCFKIAFHLPNKTVLDVASRCRCRLQLQGTMKTAEVAQKDDTARGKQLVKKGKGTRIARKSNNKIYPLSQEALNSKSIKQLIQDNNMFLKRIQDNLKTGQLANTADYFHYVKTNLDAIKQRPSKFGIKMDMPPIDEQGLEEILRARLNSLALIEDQTPKAL